MQYNNFQFNQKLSRPNYELGIIFLKKLYFVLGYSQLTMLFQVNSEGTQPYIYMYPFSPNPHSHLGCHITEKKIFFNNPVFSRK